MSKKQVLKYFRAIAKDADIAMNIDSKIPIAELALELARRGRYIDYIRTHEGNYQYGGETIVEEELKGTADKGNSIIVKNGLATLDISVETDITITDQYLDTLFDDELQAADNDGKLDNTTGANEPGGSSDNNSDLLGDDIDLSILFDNGFLEQVDCDKQFEDGAMSPEMGESKTIEGGDSLLSEICDRNENNVNANDVTEPESDSAADSVGSEYNSLEAADMTGKDAIAAVMTDSDSSIEDFDNDIENAIVDEGTVVNNGLPENQSDINNMDFDYSDNSRYVDNDNEGGTETVHGLDMDFDSCDYDYDDGEGTEQDGSVTYEFRDGEGENTEPVEESEGMPYRSDEDRDVEFERGSIEEPADREEQDLEFESEQFETPEENEINLELMRGEADNVDEIDDGVASSDAEDVVRRNYDLDVLSDFVSTDVNVDSEFETAERSVFVDNVNDGLDTTRSVHRRRTNSDISSAAVLLDSVNHDSAFNEVEANFDVTDNITDNIMDMSDSVDDSENNTVTIDNGSIEANGNEPVYVSGRRRHIPRARESDFMSFGLSDGNINSSYCNFGIDDDIDVDNNGLANFSISDTHADTFSDLSPAAQMLCGFDVNVIATSEIIPTMDLVEAVMKVAETFNNVGKAIVGGVKKVFGALAGGHSDNTVDSENEGTISEEIVENAVDMSFLDNEPVYYNNEEILQQGSVNTLNDLYDIFGYSSTNDSELGINGQSAADGEENGYNIPSNDDNNDVIERDIDYDNDTSDIDEEGVEEPEFDSDFGDIDDIIDDGIGGLLSAELDDEISSDGIRFDDF